MSNLVNYAKHELTLMGMLGSAEPINAAMAEHLVKMVEHFSAEGHSGFSASYAIRALSKLLAFEPLTPLTGEEREWMEVSNGLFQNKRCSHVFKENGEAYDINGRVFREPDGVCFINRESRVPVIFPYTPKSEYVDREAMTA